MPTSDSDGKGWAAARIEEIAPTTVVDIGPGAGTYVRLARERTPDARWIGVEAWGPYVREYGLWTLYDWVIVADVRHLDMYTVDRAPDLVILGDVLEHMTQLEARGVIARMRDWAQNLLISVPLAHHPQGEHDGNWFEVHREHWTGPQMRRELGPGLVDYREGQVLGYYWWSAAKAAGGRP
ncbi:class I SAM-dependent methyltransferase [Streptomyces sp. NPDC058847]|uniref:class I SAM-dependent methyltransferase n=1 Tax=Streptomyces sp. NPDC058847 TaxID=3346649 RepID=UPI0036A467ED